MKVRPLGNKLLVKLGDKDKQSPGGILLPDDAQAKPQKGKVIARGPGDLRKTEGHSDYKGMYWPMEVKVGDTVLLTRYAGSDIEGIDELKDHILADDRDILAVIEQ